MVIKAFPTPNMSLCCKLSQLLLVLLLVGQLITVFFIATFCMLGECHHFLLKAPLNNC